MTVIRLDAATLAQVQSAGQALLAEEAGNPVGMYLVRPLSPLDQEPSYSEEVWREIMNSPTRYTTAQVIERLRGTKGE